MRTVLDAHTRGHAKRGATKRGGEAVGAMRAYFEEVGGEGDRRRSVGGSGGVSDGGEEGEGADAGAEPLGVGEENHGEQGAGVDGEGGGDDADTLDRTRTHTHLHAQTHGNEDGPAPRGGGGVEGEESVDAPTHTRARPPRDTHAHTHDTHALTPPPPPERAGYCVSATEVAAAPKHRFYIASPLYNAARYLPEYFGSLVSQNYKEMTVVVYDDGSSDGGADVVEQFQQHGNLPFDVKLLRGEERGGPALAKWRLIEYIRETADPMDLVLFLDADDTLFHPSVLSDIESSFRAAKPWFAYGRLRGYYEEQCGSPPPVVYHANNRSSSVRSMPWVYCHPRIFRAFLLREYNERDFRLPPHVAGGRWLQKYTDRQLVYKALEVSGDNKVLFIDSMMPHVYYRVTKNSTLFLDAKIKSTDYAYVRSLPAVVPREARMPVHVVMCVHGRVSIMQKVLEENVARQDVGGRPIVLHVCNNAGASMEPVVRDILEKTTGLAGYRLRTFEDNPGGFARFNMMHDAVKEFPVDYFVMVDDDIMLPPKYGLAGLLAEGRPREYNSWWGRYFSPSKNYFYSTLNNRALKAGTGSVAKFHYAGTGVSVIDADIVRFYYHLLDKVPAKYRKVEDLWLSYVVHQLGWDVRRVKMKGVVMLEDGGIHADKGVVKTVTSTAQWMDLAGTKVKMLEDLRACGWNV